jgi:hypothetical protein
MLFRKLLFPRILFLKRAGCDYLPLTPIRINLRKDLAIKTCELMMLTSLFAVILHYLSTAPLFPYFMDVPLSFLLI